MKYESPTSSCHESMTKVKVLKSRSNFKVKVTRPKMFVPMEKSCNKECKNEI